MAQARAKKVVNTFVKGLITERSEMTFPEDASVDELNCDLMRDGTRRRRLGFQVDDLFNTTIDIPANGKVSTGLWEGVGGDPSISYSVLQVRDKLYIIDPRATPYVVRTIDLFPYLAAGVLVPIELTRSSFTSVRGSLVVANPALNTIVIENLAATPYEIIFKTRDFDWQTADKTALFTQTSSPSVGRKYDTANAGWVDGTLNFYQTGPSQPKGVGAYPPLTVPWFVMRKDDDSLDTGKFDSSWGGTSVIGNGHFVLNFFNKDREGASGILGIPNEIELSRFSCCSGYAGRVFYGGLASGKNSNKVLYTQLIGDKQTWGDCFQQNDPTSEYFSDLLDTDGGVIIIDGAVGVKAFVPFAESLIVFATNGVWRIFGQDGIFKPGAYGVSKVSDSGIKSPDSMVMVEGTPFWWSDVGIHSITLDPSSGALVEQNIIETTIQSFFDAIPFPERESVQGNYDQVAKKVYWGYSDGETDGLHKFLVLDIALKAFYPWKVENSDTGAYILGVTASPLDKIPESLGLVITKTEDAIVDNNDDNLVIMTRGEYISSPKRLLWFVKAPDGTLSIGNFDGRSFKDWGTKNYRTYAIGQYDFLGDALSRKSIIYVRTYLRGTEEGWDPYGPIRTSSLFVSASWDFKDRVSSPPQQCYRLQGIRYDSGDHVWKYDKSVLSSRVKVRGFGRVVNLKWEAEDGKDFCLVGYGMAFGSDTGI